MYIATVVTLLEINCGKELIIKTWEQNFLCKAATNPTATYTRYWFSLLAWWEALPLIIYFETFLQDCQPCFRELSLISWLLVTHLTTRMDGGDIWASPHTWACLCAKSSGRQSWQCYQISTETVTETSAKWYWIFKTPRYSEFQMYPYGIVLFPFMPVQHKNTVIKHQNPEKRVANWMVTCEENQLRSLNHRILSLWELKREISAHIATTGSDQHAKHSLTAQFCFCLFNCCYKANSFVSDSPHVDRFDTV